MADHDQSVVAATDTGEVATASVSRAREVTTALVALLTFAALTFLANDMELRREVGGIDPRWWPRALGLAGTGVAAVLLVRSLRPVGPGADAQPATRVGVVRAVVTLGLAVGYVLAWSTGGFAVPTVLFLMAATAVYGGRGWRSLLLYPLLLTGGVYLLFQTVLRVPL